MTDSNKTLLVGVIDHSGSMAHIAEETSNAWNNLVAEQCKQPGELIVTLAEFDDQYNLVYQNKPGADVPKYELKPRNYTALIDAIGRTINMVGAHLSSLPEDERPGLVIFSILTDGMENASQEYTADQIRRMIGEQQNQWGWVFQFLGANQDAVLTARSYGMRANNSMTYDTANVGQTMTATSHNIAAARTATYGGARGQSVADAAAYTDEQREDAVKKD